MPPKLSGATGRNYGNTPLSGTLDVEDEAVSKLEQAAANINLALSSLDSGTDLADIERELIPMLKRVQDEAQDNIPNIS